MWAVIAAVVTPLVAALVSFVSSERGTGIERRLRHHIALASVTDKGSDARVTLDQLVAYEAELVLKAGRLRADRKINVANLVLSILLVLITSAAIYGGVLWAIAAWSGGLAWIPVILLATVGLFLLLLTAFGFTTLYNPPKKDDTPKEK